MKAPFAEVFMSRRLLIEIAEDPGKLKDLMRREPNPNLRDRLHVLYLLSSGAVVQEQDVARILARGTATIRRWLNAYKSGGLEALLSQKPKTGKPRSVPPDVVAALEVRLANLDGAFRSYGEAQRWLAESFGVEVDYKVVHALIKYRLKVPPEKLPARVPFSRRSEGSTEW
ncbi:MAG: helix-turn-helix domain-containing protein [Gemmatimonadaceae bacterium]|nr:helix-turn-helix domain-containing protein [Gloeobacterales cyanobacterium ES-bin-141]